MGKFVNCYGIQNFTLDEIRYSHSNKAIIYAPNGVMKSSLARTFEQLSKNELPIDRIYPDRLAQFDITYRNHNITHNTNKSEFNQLNTFVINSFDEAYQSDNISNLLVDSNLRSSYEKLIKSFEKDLSTFLSLIRKKSNIPMRTLLTTIIEDFDLTDTDDWIDVLIKLEKRVTNYSFDTQLDDVRYVEIFNDKTSDLFNDPSFIKNISIYVNRVNELLEESMILSNNFNDHNAIELGKTFDKHNLFASSNKIVLNNGKEISNTQEWNEVLNEELKNIKNDSLISNVYEQISKKINKNAQASVLRNALASNEYLVMQLNNISELKKNLWLNYFKSVDTNYKDLLDSIKIYKSEIENLMNDANSNKTLWQSTIKEFNNRFQTPYKLQIQNQANVILKNEIPQVMFVYEDADRKINKTHAEMMKILSMGERRALYLLNVLFDIRTVINETQIKKQHTLVILDDIADSFDYKNKYSIIEYINDISDNQYIDILLLTHNFDFYRTVRNRIGIKSINSFIVQRHNSDEIKMSTFGYTKDVFQAKVVSLLRSGKLDTIEKKKWLVAGIPFLRNISEYLNKEEDRDTLTKFLHIKEGTEDYQLEDLWVIYQNIIACKPLTGIDPETNVINLIFELANNIACEKSELVNLENKIVMSIAIRLKCEQVMIKIAKIKSVTLNESTSNQTRHWFNALNSHVTDEESLIFERVLMTTSENIHINAFMYEPIIDISDWHLKNIYENLLVFEDKYNNVTL